MRRLGVPTARALAGAAAVAMLLALPAGALAVTNVPIAQTGGMTVTMPIMASGLTVTVVLDTATGNITSTTVSDPLLTQTSTSQSFVKFANTGSTEKVTVKAVGSKLAISAKVTTLAELLGTGTWSADVFGTGTKTAVGYTIGDDGSGNPTVTLNGDPTPLPSGATWTAMTPKTGDGDSEATATAGGSFSYQGFTKQLRITVTVDKEDGYARLGITLTGRDRQVLTGTLAALAAAGPRTWSGIQCDGTPVSVTYHVEATGSGSVVFDSSTPTGAVSSSIESGIAVYFPKTNVGVVIRLRDNGDGTYTLQVVGHSGNCGKPSHKGQQGDHHAGSGKQGAPSGWVSPQGGQGGDQGGFGGGDH
jgi:hypothetical protein